jgi:hypothetical protein
LVVAHAYPGYGLLGAATRWSMLHSSGSDFISQ